MPPDITAIIAQLPPGVQIACNILLFLIGAGLVAWNGVKGVKQGKRAKPEQAEDAAAFLDSSLVQRAVLALETLAMHIPIQTEAMKTVAAAQTASAKLIEEDFDQLRIYKAVQEELAKAEERRQKLLDIEEERAERRRQERAYQAGRTGERGLDRTSFPP